MRMRFRVVAATVALAGPGWAAALAAQEPVWVQIEAQSTIDDARDMARDYAEFLEEETVFGYRLESGWYAIVVGPYASRDDANDARLVLRSDNLIPPDSFATEGEAFDVRFWPAGPADAALTPFDPDIAPLPGPGEPDPAGAPTGRAAFIDLEALRAELARREAEAAAEPGSEPVETDEPTADAATDPGTQAEPIATEAPEPEPEETVAEARRSEAQLDRGEREDLQVALQWFGHYTMAIDGAIGPGTRAAMTAWQQERGHEPTGVLSTRQRAELLEAEAGERAALGIETVQHAAAGIEIPLPTAMLSEDRIVPPFVHYESVDDSGMRALLISQQGGQPTLEGLFEIMQTLEAVPLEGERELRGDSFVITGRSDDRRARIHARVTGGAVKGYALIWEPRADDAAERVLDAMESGFSPLDGTLEDAHDEPIMTAHDDLVAGLQVRRPERSNSGFYIDASGRVLTTLAAVDQCERITIDDSHEASIMLRDAALGVAVLETEGLAPPVHATFGTDDPRPGDEVAVSGFSFADMLSRPILTYGQLETLSGLNGEEDLARLSIEVESGDAGGPVLDRSGSVIGMLLSRDEGSDRVLPQDVNFAARAPAITTFLNDSGPGAETRDRNDRLAPAQLNGLASDMTVLVSCW